MTAVNLQLLMFFKQAVENWKKQLILQEEL